MGRHPVALSLCVNSAFNGAPTGRILALEVHPEVIEIEAPYPPPICVISRRRNRFRLDGKTYTYLLRVPAYGNWCWDLITVRSEDAVDILDRLRKTERWSISAGAWKVYGKWERGEKILAEDLTGTDT